MVVAIQQQNYKWALANFHVVVSITDLLDGLLARVLKQKTTLGQYLDPIATNKLLLGTMYLMLSIAHVIRLAIHHHGFQP